MGKRFMGGQFSARRVTKLASCFVVGLILASCGAAAAGRRSALSVVAAPTTRATTSTTMAPHVDPAALADAVAVSLLPVALNTDPAPAPVQATPSAPAPTASPTPKPAAAKPAAVSAPNPAASAPKAAAPTANPCAVAVAYIQAHGAPGWTTVCGYHAGYDNPGCVAAAERVGGRYPYGCTDAYNLTTYIACPVFTVYANEAENQRYVSGLGGRFDAFGEAPQCAYANPLGR